MFSFQPGFDSGCTAVVALKVASRLFVANAGDSRCVLSVKSVATPLSHDHNPSVLEEVARVEAAGGKISAGRVDGGLNLTRAFGWYTIIIKQALVYFTVSDNLCIHLYFQWHNSQNLAASVIRCFIWGCTASFSELTALTGLCSVQ